VERLVRAAKVVVGDDEIDGRRVVLTLLREGVAGAGEPPSPVAACGGLFYVFGYLPTDNVSISETIMVTRFRALAVATVVSGDSEPGSVLGVRFRC
jgi:hypothetical protein